ncbi:MAG: phosphatase PAP2 family protein [Verrucomicrobiia bacterium]
MFDDAWSQVISWDHALLRKINGEWTAPWADQWFSLSADFGLLFWPFALLLALLLIFGRFRERLFLLLLTACLLIGDAGLNSTIKREVNRPRPYQALDNVRHVKQGRPFEVRVELSRAAPVERGRSMTSGHVCNNVAVGVLLTVIYWPWGLLIWPWVLSMSYARIYTGDHFPTDVIASWALALTYASLICCAAQWLWRRCGPRFMPQTHAAHPSLFPAFTRKAGRN